jgi:hypothetical protein
VPSESSAADSDLNNPGPRPPPLMVMNEPETSLHPDLLSALERLISRASRNTQVWVVSHARRLVATLEAAGAVTSHAPIPALYGTGHIKPPLPFPATTFSAPVAAA